MRVLQRVGDEGSLVYGAQLVTEGALPYRDFFEVMGPASFYWLGLFFKLFGINLYVARALLLITATLTIFLIYWITRRLYRGPFDYLPPICYMLISFPIWPATNHHWDSNLFGLLAIVTFLLWEDTRNKKYLIAAGIIAGLTSCFMVQKGLLLFLAFIVILIINGKSPCEEKRRTLIDVGIVVSAYVSVAVIVLFLFYVASGMDDLLYANLVWPLNNYEKVNVVPYGYGILECFWPEYQMLFEYLSLPKLSHTIGMLILLPFFIILTLPLLLTVLSAILYISHTDRAKILTSAMVICLSTGIALWISEIHRMDINHLIYGSPMLIIILFTVWDICFEKKRAIYQVGLMIAIIPLIFVATFNLITASTANHKLVTRRGIIYSHGEDMALNFLLEKIPPRSTVFVYPYYPMYYFLANVRNPSRYSILVYHINTEDQFNETVTALEQKKVKYVLWDTFAYGPNLKKWLPQYSHPPNEMLHLEEYLEKHYKELDVRNGFRILERIGD